MTEIEQLRKEINELRERLARLEARKERAEKSELDELQKLKREWLEAEKAKPVRLVCSPIAQPYWTHETPRHFPPGTILC